MVKSACSWCEGELGTANTSRNHGICKRHIIAQYKQMGLNPPASAESNTIPDLSTMPPELVDIAVKITAIQKKKKGLR